MTAGCTKGFFGLWGFLIGLASVRMFGVALPVRA